MKTLTSYIAGYFLALNLVACNTDSDSGSAATETQQDSTEAATQPAAPDRTLQPKDEIVLKALGDTISEIRFDKDTLQVERDAFVKLQLVNEGTNVPMVHNVVVTEHNKYKLIALAGARIGPVGNYVPESPMVIAASPLAKPGQTVLLEFKAPSEPGTYDFVCTYPGHWKRMHGILIVK